MAQAISNPLMDLISLKSAFGILCMEFATWKKGREAVGAGNENDVVQLEALRSTAATAIQAFEIEPQGPIAVNIQNFANQAYYLFLERWKQVQANEAAEREAQLDVVDGAEGDGGPELPENE